MKFFRNILNQALSFIEIAVSNTLPADQIILTKENLNEAIRLSKISLSDPFILKRPSLLAATYYSLAVNYYRKCIYSSNFINEDVKLSIFYAEKAIVFFTREERTGAWQQLQQVLGFMYFVKGDGVRAEHYESAIGYLENWLNSLNDINKKLEIYILLMMAYASRMKGSKEDNHQRIEKYYQKALDCNPSDLEINHYINQQKIIVDILKNRDIFDLPDGSEFDNLAGVLKEMFKHLDSVESDRFDPLHLFLGLHKLGNIIEKALAPIGEGMPDAQIEKIKRQIINGQHFDVINQISQLNPESSKIILSEMDELIQETLQIIENLGEATERNEKAEGDAFISLLYIIKAPLCEKDVDVKESLDKAEFYFEKSWNYKTNFQKRPFMLFWQGKSFGLLLYFARGKWEKAATLYQETLDALELNYISSMGVPGKNIILSLLSAQDDPLSLNQAFALAKLGKDLEAVVTLEKWRGRYLNEMLDRNNYMLGKINKSDFEEYQHLWTDISKIEMQMDGENNEDYHSLGIELKEKQKDLKVLISQIREYLPDFLLDYDFSDFQDAIQPKNSLVYLLTTGLGCLILIVKSNGEIKSLFFDEFTIGEAANLFEELQFEIAKIKSGNAESSNFAETLEKIGEYFMQELIDEISSEEGTSVCLIPCGILSQFPWHAVPTKDGQILLDDFDVRFAPTANFLFDAQKKLAEMSDNSLNVERKFIGVADPENNLKYASMEIKNIVKIYKNNKNEIISLSNNQATKKDLKNHMPSEVLHFASHGKFNSQNPLDSTLNLANNEKLLLREILEDDSLNLSQTRLAVLSACETALVDINEKPEENIGMPLGFLSKGIPGVVGTLWSVNDKSSALLMTKFYEFWLTSDKNSKPVSPSKALMEAQRWFRKTAKENPTELFDSISRLEKTAFNREAYSGTKIVDTYDNPYYWAGFIFIGV